MDIKTQNSVELKTEIKSQKRRLWFDYSFSSSEKKDQVTAYPTGTSEKLNCRNMSHQLFQ